METEAFGTGNICVRVTKGSIYAVVASASPDLQRHGRPFKFCAAEFVIAGGMVAVTPSSHFVPLPVAIPRRGVDRGVHWSGLLESPSSENSAGHSVLHLHHHAPRAFHRHAGGRAAYLGRKKCAPSPTSPA